MAYSGQICAIKTKPHSNADNVQLGVVNGNQVVIGKDIANDAIGIYFDCDGQLSEAYCTANDLCTRFNEEGKKIGGGYFASNRRVCAQNFRGEKSNGFWMPLQSLQFTGANLSALKVGDEITELNGIPICCKYETPATQRAKNLAKNASKVKGIFKAKVHYVFPKHFDTLQFRKNLHAIKPGSRVVISAKLHGTSNRIGNVLVSTQLHYSWWKRMIARLLHIPLYEEALAYAHTLGSRNVTLTEKSDGKGHEHQDRNFRRQSLGSMEGNLHKGEIVFHEIVGWQGAKTIMPSVEISKMKDKAVAKLYGKTMSYLYGCKEGECKSYIYRIAYVNPDGVLFELPWEAVKARAIELGVPTVPELHVIGNYNGNAEELQELVASFLDKPAVLDATHVEEGVCIRAEFGNSMQIFKQKGFIFSVLEGIAKEKDDYVDEEEAN